jgi:diaminopimelate epimerase
MLGIDFWKMQGSGNDFILIDNRDGKIRDEKLGELVTGICRRRESVGADGVIFVKRSERFDFAWRFFNADGGEAEMCGNGGRCVARFAYLTGIAGDRMSFETLAGPVAAEVRGRLVKVRMPKPKNLKLDIGLQPVEGWKSVDFIDTGVPHVVVMREGLNKAPVAAEGRRIRYHKRFAPAGTNADFMWPAGSNSLEIRTYERGVENETLACGTGAIASSLIAAARGIVDSPVKVRTSGGEELTVHFSRKGEVYDEVWLEGNTAVIYRARLDEEAV